MIRLGRPRKYTFDEFFFDKIDSQEKAYIIGLFYADGTVSLKKYTTCAVLVLSDQDKEILNRIRSIWKGLPPIRAKKLGQYSKQAQWKLQISSVEVCHRLAQLGCHPNKSLTLRFPGWLDSAFYKHFIRGYFDGDGSVGIYSGRPRACITGTRSFLTAVQNIVQEQGVKSGIYRKEDDLFSVCSLQFWGKNVILFLDWLYQGANLYFQRKYLKYSDIRSRPE